MSDKQQALEAIQKLPESASMEDIVEELCFRMKVEQGLADMAAGRTVSDDELGAGPAE